ncbi:MAG: ABC transporter ATP-binding protein [candidate division WOR-3 bacterium]|uniref:ABC transporter ATP-binding protein n=1 Tax=candidate division WOR-3 bacterium TaxID=2052148 RepID=A0A7C4S2B2_UNCW3
MPIFAYEIKNLYFQYRKEEPLFEGLSIKIKEKEWFSIIGPNGSGKTTLLKLMAGLLRPQKGAIILFNNNLFSLTSKERAKFIGYFPQESFFIFDYTVKEIVLMGRNPYVNWFSQVSKKDIEVVERCMELTETINLKDKKISELSSGERKRVILARILAQEPKVLLLDEFTTHLDISYQLEFINLLKRLKEAKDLTIVFLTHDLNLASISSDRILLIDKGKYVACDIPEKILKEDLIAKVYKIKPIVKIHPLNNRPLIIF